jgi:4-amino-4-deoxy-L-arabinose transferase-like glycosyltransferase
MDTRDIPLESTSTTLGRGDGTLLPRDDGQQPASGLRFGKWHEAGLLGLLLAYAVLMWVWGAGRLDIAHAMEAGRAVGARTMMETGDYLVPHLGAEVNLRKPPLFYWLAAMTSRLCGGTSETAVRLPSALSAMVILLVLYFAMRPVFGSLKAYGACLVAATLPMVLPAATVGDVNMLLAAGVAISTLAAFHMLEQPRYRWVYAVLCGIGLAVGLMTKGPIVLLFFVPTVLLYMGYRHGGTLANNWRWSLGYMAIVALLFHLSLWTAVNWGTPGGLLYVAPLGMLLYFGLRGVGRYRCAACWFVVAAVALLLSAPWPMLVIQRLGFEQVHDVLVREAWQLRSSDVKVSNEAPIWHYLLTLPVATLPWSLLVPLAFFPRYGSNASDREKKMLLLARCWLVGSVVLFTVISPARRTRYVLPVFPAISLLAADAYVRGVAGALRPGMNRYVRHWAVVLAYALCGAPILLAVMWLASGLPLSASGFGMVAVAGAGLGVYLHRFKRSQWAAPVALAMALLAGTIFLHFGHSQIFNRQESPRLACEQIRKHVPTGDKLYLYGQVRPEAVFYLHGESLELPQVLALNATAFICVDTRNAETPDQLLPCRYTEVARARYGKDDLVLLKADCHRVRDGDAPGNGGGGGSRERGEAPPANRPEK